MRLKTKLLILISGLALVLFSCQDIIQIKLNQAESTLSVDAVLTDRGGEDTIKLSSASGYFSNQNFVPYTGAKVILSDSIGSSESLIEVSPGIFPVKKTLAELNHTYFLDIITSRDHFRATSQVKRISPRLDSIQFQYEQKSFRYDSAGFYLYLFGQELSGLGDRAWIRVYRNNISLNRPRDLFVINDDLTDGKYYHGLSLRTEEAFQAGNTARVEVWSLNKDGFNYLDQIQTQINNRGIFQTTPSNPISNFHNLNPNSKAKATGFFMTSLVESISQQVF